MRSQSLANPNKMKRLNDVIGQFLKSDESLRAGPHLGPVTRKVSPEKVTFLIDQLKLASKQNGRIVTVLVALYVAMLIGGFVIVFSPCITTRRACIAYLVVRFCRCWSS